MVAVIPLQVGLVLANYSKLTFDSKTNQGRDNEDTDFLPSCVTLTNPLECFFMSLRLVREKKAFPLKTITAVYLSSTLSKLGKWFQKQKHSSASPQVTVDMFPLR